MSDYSEKIDYSLGLDSYVERFSTGYVLIQGLPEPGPDELFMFRSVDDLLECERDNVQVLLGEKEK